MGQYRYSVPDFRRSVAVAAAITAMVAGVVWMLVRAAGRADALFWSLLAALVFFALVSASMLLRFVRNEVILAVRPTGLFDARQGGRTVPWEEIRDIVLNRRENEFELEVYMWQPQYTRGAEAKADFIVDLQGLEAAPRQIVEDIAGHKPVIAGPGAGEAM